MMLKKFTFIPRFFFASESAKSVPGTCGVYLRS